MSEKSPKTVALLSEFARLKTVNNWTFENLRVKLNEQLSPDRRIPDTRNGRSQIERWLRPERRGWVEPRGEVILAVQSVVANNLVNENSA